MRLLLGPDVDPADALAGAALVDDLAVDQPRLPDDRAAPPRGARATSSRAAPAGDAAAPAIVSEVDLFLRLCPAPTIGITGTKGKTTTSALTHALLATDDRRTRRSSAATSACRSSSGCPSSRRATASCVELSELQLPTLSRGHDRRGLHERHRRPPRPARHARGVPARSSAASPSSSIPAGALVLNLDDPVVAGYGAATAARVVRYRRGELPPGGLGVAHGWIVADAIEPLAGHRADSAAAPFAGRPRSCPLAELGVPGRPQRLERAGRGRRRAPVRDPGRRRSGARPRRSRASSTAWSASRRSTASASSTTPRAPSPTRSSRRCARSTRPIVLIAGGRDKGVDLTDLAAVVAERAAAAVLIGESGPDARAPVPRRRPRDDRARRLAGGGRRGGRRAGPRGRPLAASGRRTGRHGAAEPGRGELRHVRGLRGPRPRVQGRGRAARRASGGLMDFVGRRLLGCPTRLGRARRRRGRRRRRRAPRRPAAGARAPVRRRGATRRAAPARTSSAASATSPTTRSCSPSSPSPRSAS